MDYKKYALSLLGLLAVGMLYEKLNIRTMNDEDARNYELVKKYLLNDSSLARSKYPIIWIHLNYEPNARRWLNFGSRLTENLNQPYLYLTLKSVIDKCGSHFNVCLIDDNSFEKIIPGWTVDMSRIADPIKSKVRELAMARLLKHYGGMRLPSGFLCMKNLADMYYTMTCSGKMFIGELTNQNSSSTYVDLYPSNKIMGCSRNCKVIEKYISYLESVVSIDYTAESEFLGSQNRWLYEEMLKNNNLNKIPAELLGITDTQNKLVTLERLMGNTYVDFVPTILGVCIPEREILKRTKFEWFSRLSANQAISCDNILGKLLLTTVGN
jgi:hypothetical protein